MFVGLFRGRPRVASCRTDAKHKQQTLALIAMCLRHNLDVTPLRTARVFDGSRKNFKAREKLQHRISSQLDFPPFKNNDVDANQIQFSCQGMQDAVLSMVRRTVRFQRGMQTQ